jgi:prolyl-tRNA synthetase
MAAVIEQHHDDDGITWPKAVAPVDVQVIVLGAAGQEVIDLGESVADDVGAAGFAVLLDDRDQRPGEKFADADMLGAPIRITVGKKSLADESIDLRGRATGEETRVPASIAADEVSRLWAAVK